jgi:hypothetical protein
MIAIFIIIKDERVELKGYAGLFFGLRALEPQLLHLIFPALTFVGSALILALHTLQTYILKNNLWMASGKVFFTI